MAGKKGKSGGQREGSGRHKTQPTIKKQLMFFKDTLKAYLAYKEQYEENQLALAKQDRKPFTDILNERLLSVFR